MRLTRSISGLLLLDKPLGISSQQAVTKVKYAFQAEKAGHTGTLDPLATGMLPICLGEATKFSRYLLDAPKTYYVVAQLGVRTDTGDAAGEIIEQKPVAENIATKIDGILKNFQGQIQQIPPMYSAIKFQGKALYKLARAGKVVEREPRTITIYNLTRIPGENAEQFALEVTCSKGTYIRTLIEDIGAALGCGAHVMTLRRLQVNHFSAPQMWPLSKIKVLTAAGDYAALDTLLLPITVLVEHVPKVIISQMQAKRLQQGVAIPLITSTLMDTVQIITETDDFIGIGEIQTEGILSPKRLMRFSTLKMTK